MIKLFKRKHRIREVITNGVSSFSPQYRKWGEWYSYRETEHLENIDIERSTYIEASQLLCEHLATQRQKMNPIVKLHEFNETFEILKK